MEIQAGRTRGKVQDYAFKRTQAGDPAVVIIFSFVQNEETFDLTWQGSLKDAKEGSNTTSAKEITFKALQACGFDFASRDARKNWDAIAQGAVSKVLDLDREVSLTIEHEASPKDGKLYPRIRWVNPLGGGQFQNLMNPAEAVQVFSGMNIYGDIMAFGQKSKAPAATNANGARPPAMPDGRPVAGDDLPF